MKKRNLIIVVIALVAIVIVISLYLYFNNNFYKNSLSNLNNITNCGSIEKPMRGVEGSLIEAKDKVNCFLTNFEECNPAILIINSYGYEAEKYDEKFIITQENNNCVIKKYLYNDLWNTCSDINVSYAYNEQYKEDCIKWELLSCTPPKDKTSTDTRLSICSRS